MEQKTNRLRRMALDAINEYKASILAGGEPSFPQWAPDMFDVLDAMESIGAGGGTAGKSLMDGNRPAEHGE